MVGGGNSLAWPVLALSVQSIDLQILFEDAHNRKSAIEEKTYCSSDVCFWSAKFEQLRLLTDLKTLVQYQIFPITVPY
jgi:hypothetical protein